MIVPNAAPTRMSDAERRAVDSAVSGILGGDRWIQGPAVEGFESEFAEYLGFGTVVGVGNGTDALAIAFGALDLPAGSGVLLAANEGGYAATACRLAGLEPVVMDVAELSMLPTPEMATAAMVDGVSAIVVTHLHGEANDIHELDAWRRARGLALVEDCAQGVGARDGHGHVGNLGDAATFSFYPTKNLGAVGDAGAVAFADPAHAQRGRTLREYGWGERFRVDVARGRNSRMDSLHAAVLSARLPFLDDRNDRRRSISARYAAALDPRRARLHGDLATTTAHHSVVVTDRRDELALHLEYRGIGTAVHYPYLVTDMPGIGATEPMGGVPVAAALRDRILSLPCYPEMTDEELALVLEAIGEWNAVA